MNSIDLHDEGQDGREPPSADCLAAEYVVGVLDAADRQKAQARIESDPGFKRLVAAWEVRLAPLLEDIGPEPVPAHVWLRIRSQLGWSPVQSAREGILQSVNFWRFSTAIAASVALAAVLLGRGQQALEVPVAQPIAVQAPVEPVPEEQAAKPVTTLVHDDGTPGWLASVDPAHGTVLMVPVPAPADSAGRVPELWLIPAGGKAESLGIVSIDKSHTVAVPAALRNELVRGSTLAITLEPEGGAPGGVATGPIIAKGELLSL